MKWANPLVAVTSAIVLVAEIVAARMVAPYVGVTLETFSAVIGCVLGAIALGNWCGGRLADRADPRPALGAVCAFGGIGLLLAPAIVHRLGPVLAGPSPFAALALATVGFAMPCAALSAVSPIVVRHLGSGSTRLGRVAGNVSAFATVGALLGNFGAGFWLVGAFGSTAILVGVGSVATAIGVVLLAAIRIRRPLAIGAVAATSAIGLGTLATIADASTPCTIETAYVCLSIDEPAPDQFHVRSNIYSSSYTNVADPTDLRLPYARDVAAVIDAARPGASHIVTIGGGGETLVRYLASTRPTSSQTVIEIDSALATAVRDHLGPFMGDERVRTIIGDAGLVMRDLPYGGADVVIGDAFSGLAVPWHLTTVEFLTLVRDRLTADGIYVMNVVDAGNYALARAEIATLARVFDEVVVLTRGAALEPNGPNTNLVVVAGSRLPGANELEVAVRNAGSSSIVVSGDALTEFVDGAALLTDDHAPTDQLVDAGR